MGMKVGILGGTFDPVHLGHLLIAQEARYRLQLSRVLFIPAGQPWLKAGQAITPAHHRLEMLRRALASNPAFEASTVELERPGPSYTVDTLAQLKQELGAEAELYLILGQDALNDLPRWREPHLLAQLCFLAALPRPGCPPPDLDRLEVAVPGLKQKVILLNEAPQVSISASEIRERVARGEPIAYWVPEAVEEYIMEKRLYA